MKKLLAAILLAASMPGLAASVAFVDVNVVPMDRDRVLTGQTVVVADGRIVELGDRHHVTVPDDATRVPGRGRYLMPGLYEMHAHVPRDQADIDRVLTLFLANGVTTIRGMLGAPVHLPLRQALADGQQLGPRLITSGPSFNGRSVSGRSQAMEMVRDQAEAGYDFLKLHPGLSADEFDAIVEAAQKTNMPFAGHVSVDVGLARALAAKQDSIDHLDGYMQAMLRSDVSLADHEQGFFGLGLADMVDPERISKVAAETRAANVWNVPTQTLIEHYVDATPPAELAGRDEMRYMPRGTVSRWRQSKENTLDNEDFDTAVAARAIEVRRQLIKALHDAGAGLLLGSDAPQVFNVPGFATHEELTLLVASGLTPWQALETGTVNPARYFGEKDRRGLVQEGYVADLILLEANPLGNIAHTQKIAGVMTAGRWLDRAALDEMLKRFDETR